MATLQRTPIDYQPVEVLRRERLKKRFGQLGVFALVFLIIWSIAKFGGPLWIQWQQARLQSELAAQESAVASRRRSLIQPCLNYSALSNAPVYLESSDLTTYLRSGEYEVVNARSLNLNQFAVGVAKRAPECWKRLNVTHEAAPVAFLHRLTSSSGTERLVCVEFHTMQYCQLLTGSPESSVLFSNRSLSAWVIDPNARRTAGLVGNSHLFIHGGPRLQARGHIEDVRGQLKTSNFRTDMDALTKFVLFGGSPDSNDLSHFTIPYVYNGNSGTIDGWLTDSDVVEFRPREGSRLPRGSVPNDWNWFIEDSSRNF